MIGQPDLKDVASVDQVVEKAHAMKLKHLVFGYIGKVIAKHPTTIAATQNTPTRRAKSAKPPAFSSITTIIHSSLQNYRTGQRALMSSLKSSIRNSSSLNSTSSGYRSEDVTPLRQSTSYPPNCSAASEGLKKGTPVITDEGSVPADAFKDLAPAQSTWPLPSRRRQGRC